uniref:C-type lectin domain-containing protein n=1 Tax=Acrobeloides nanus TaxID=290746 RepID=A0A914CQ71_9BILA
MLLPSTGNYVNVTDSGGSTSSIQSSSTTQPTASTASSAPKTCGNGNWTIIEDRCLNVYPIAKNWSDASSACHGLGGFLMTVFDQKDTNFIDSKALNVSFFIGLNDRDSIGIFIWDQPNATINNETAVSIAQNTKEALTPKTATSLDVFQVSVILEALAKVPSLSEEITSWNNINNGWDTSGTCQVEDTDGDWSSTCTQNGDGGNYAMVN